jgi:hypothetical protein
MKALKAQYRNLKYQQSLKKILGIYYRKNHDNS